MATRTLEIERVIGNWVLDAASNVGRLTYFTLDVGSRVEDPVSYYAFNLERTRSHRALS